MNNLHEIPSSTYREIDGKKYIVKKFGLNNQVFEEHLIPIPDKKIIRTFKDGGTEDETKRLEIDLRKVK